MKVCSETEFLRDVFVHERDDSVLIDFLEFVGGGDLLYPQDGLHRAYGV